MALLSAAQEFRARALARDQAILDEITQRYGMSHQIIQYQLSQLTDQIETARAAGEDVHPAWLFRQERYRQIQRQVQMETMRLARDAVGLTEDGQRAAMEAAIDEAGQLGRAALPPGLEDAWTTIDPRNVEHVIGVASDGTPLARSFSHLPLEAQSKVTQSLVNGVVLGRHPSVVARDVRSAMGSSLSKALTISRTEMLRAYRETTREAFAENGDVLDGWTWQSARKLTTCGVCWSMHGTVHDIEEILNGHPNCRCTMVPLTKPWEEFGVTGVTETRTVLKSGESEFRKLTAQQQRAILGPSKYEAYRDGKVTLGDLTTETKVGHFGKVRQEKPLEEALDEPKTISRADAAAKMYGKGSPQHKAALKRWGSGGPRTQVG